MTLISSHRIGDNHRVSCPRRTAIRSWDIDTVSIQRTDRGMIRYSHRIMVVCEMMVRKIAGILVVIGYHHRRRCDDL